MTSVSRTAALHNLGCKVNAYETEVMRQQLAGAGYTIVPFHEKADVYVINTCSVTNIADRKSRQMISRARKMNPDAVVAAVGCYVQTAVEKTSLPVEADLVLGNDRKGRIVELLDSFFENRARQERLQDVPDISAQKEYEHLSLEGQGIHTRAFLKVEDGCNQFCSYCIIPYARGRVRSRGIDDTVEEITRLAGSGVREVVLTGIHLSAYGTDLGMEAGDGLMRLIRAASDVEGISRIRLGSLEPGIITEGFARELAANKKICPHFHLSLQSGCNTVLKRMNRHYDTDSYAEKCRILREAFDDPALTTDVIVGFPGESVEEFEQTVDFLKKIRFYETHIFKYSPREGTRAARMDGQLTEKEKAVRSDRLIGLGTVNKAAYEERIAQREVELLVEEKVIIGGEAFYSGHTREYIHALARADELETISFDVSGKVFSGRMHREGENWLFGPNSDSGIEYSY